MIGGSKAHVYVSVKQGVDGSSEGHYRRSHPVWMLSVEPNKHHVPGLPHSPAEPIHIIAVIDESGESYTVKSHSASSDGGMLGNILLSESAHTSPEEVVKFLKERLTTASSSLPSENSAEDDPDHWLRKGLHVLQVQKVIDHFDVGEFMTYAHAYAANREAHEAPALVGYPGAHKNHQKKAKKQNFWISYPTASKINPRTGLGEKHNLYGGLM